MIMNDVIVSRIVVHAPPKMSGAGLVEVGKGCDVAPPRMLK